MILKRRLTSGAPAPQGWVKSSGYETTTVTIRIADNPEYWFLLEKVDQQDLTEIANCIEGLTKQLTRSANMFASLLKGSNIDLPLLPDGGLEGVFVVEDGRIVVREVNHDPDRPDNGKLVEAQRQLEEAKKRVAYAEFDCHKTVSDYNSFLQAPIGNISFTSLQGDKVGPSVESKS